jgi:mono/diheme cytochrome c family protein
MPADMFAHLSDADLLRIVAWVRTLEPTGPVHPERRIGLLGRFGLATGKYRMAAQLADPSVTAPADRPPDGDALALGRYLALSSCSECHGQDLAGGGEMRTPHLAIAASYTPGQFHHFLRTGERPDGTRTEFMSMMCDLRFAHMTDAEIDALHTYLVTLAGQGT